MKNAFIFITVLVISIITLYGCQAPETEKTGEMPAVEETPLFQASVILLNYPGSAAQGQEYDVSWRVLSSEPMGIEHTAVHYGYVSVPGVLGTDVLPANSGYALLTAPQSGAIPNSFSDKIIAEQAGTLYLRPHAIIDGRNYWGNEAAITANPVETKGLKIEDLEVADSGANGESKIDEVSIAAVEAKEFTIEADDDGLYPSETINVNKGDKVSIIFKVRKTGVYYGGLDFKSSVFNTGAVLPGQSTTVEFTAEDTFTFTSYWPKKNVKKADGKVVVG